MGIQIPITEFAPAERVPIEVVYRQSKAIMESSASAAILSNTMHLLFILNKQRQVVFASQNWKEVTAIQDCKCLLGLRPGEVLGCVHAGETEGGCGTTESCRECGAVQAILQSLSGHTSIQECRVTRIINCNTESMDLLVYAVPFNFNGEIFSIFSVTDISHLKRRRALERIFFHDVVNTASGLESLSEILMQDAPEDLKPDLGLLHSGLQSLMEEILCQRDLTSAENNELVPHPTSLRSLDMLEQIARSYQMHEVGRDRVVLVAPQAADVAFVSDATLVRRILGNLVKNALEATAVGGVVTLNCETGKEEIKFTVHNEGEMPRSVQLQLFQRSFSTKGEGRGLGTYSIKLLTEKYLRGSVELTTSAELGTLFRIRLPLTLTV